MKSFPCTKIFGIVLSVATFASCTDHLDIDGEEDVYYGREMVFSALSEMAESSRGGSLSNQTAHATSRLILAGETPTDSLFCVVTTAPIAASEATSRGTYLDGQNDFSQMSVTAVTRKTADNARSYYFENTIYSRTSETDAGSTLNLWQCDNIYYWWGEQENYTFYAVAPWGVQNSGLDIHTETTTPYLTYTVPSASDRQTDLMAVKTAEYPGNHNKSVALEFKHLLSAIEIKQGTGMRTGTIKSVTFKNIKTGGTYSFDSGWTPGDRTGSFSLEDNFPTSDNASLSGTENIMFLMPQNLEGASVEVTIVDNGQTKVYSSNLSGSWIAGSRYTYTITINPEFKFEPESVRIDAHYEKFAVTVTPEGFGGDLEWTLSCGVEGVTFLSDADYGSKEEYALLRDGFWTDRILDGDSGNRDIGSARGSSTITFTGSNPQKVWVMVPENAGTADRPITLRANIAGNGGAGEYNKVVQYAAFGANDGWEQTADSRNGAYGFCWDLKVSYQLVYSSNTTFGSDRQTYCNNLIKNNNASTYAYTQSFDYTDWRTRYCITLDYSKLSDLNVALSRTDGATNTKELYNFGKGASTASFEAVILNTKKTESGMTGEPAFRKMKSSDLRRGSWANFGNDGTPVSGSDAVGSILKKNRYNIVKSAKTSGGLIGGGSTVISYSASLSESDIVWYLPAVDEFNNAQSAVVDAIDKNGWSSTAVAGATNSYLGNHTSTNRKTEAVIRARRSR